MISQGPGEGHGALPDMLATSGVISSVRTGAFSADQDGDALRNRAQSLFDQVRAREAFFRRTVMADSAMGVMLSLLLAELRGVPMTEATLALVNLLDAREAGDIIASLAEAGLIAMAQDSLGRPVVALTTLGSTRMRRFIGDYPDH